MPELIPFVAATNIVKLDWGDINYARKKGLIGDVFIRKFAEQIAFMANQPPDGVLLEILWSEGDLSYLCDKISHGDDKSDTQLQTIWSCILLRWIGSAYSQIDEAPRVLDDAINRLGNPEYFDEIRYMIANSAGNPSMYYRRAGTPYSAADALLVSAIRAAGKRACGVTNRIRSEL